MYVVKQCHKFSEVTNNSCASIGSKCVAACVRTFKDLPYTGAKARFCGFSLIFWTIEFHRTWLMTRCSVRSTLTRVLGRKVHSLSCVFPSLLLTIEALIDMGASRQVLLERHRFASTVDQVFRLFDPLVSAAFYFLLPISCKYGLNR